MTMKLEHAETPCVIVATGGCWGNLLAFVRSLGSRGVDVYLVGVGCDLAVAGSSRYCAGIVRLIGGSDIEVANQLLHWRWEKGWSNNPVLFFVSERLGRMFCYQRKELETGFVVPMPDAEVLGRLLRKDAGLEIARQAGLSVPKSWPVTTEQEMKQACESAILPVVLKPLGADTLGIANFKASVVESRDALYRLASTYWSSGAHFLIQQYIPGEDATLWAYQFYRSRNTGKVYEWTGRKLLQSPPGAGIMASGIACSAPHVADAARKYVIASGYWGIGGVEFKEYKGELYFIEMNPRAEAIQPMAISDGMDFPVMAYAEASGQNIPDLNVVSLVSDYVDGEAYLGILIRKKRFYYLTDLIKKVSRCKTVFPVWRIDDPRPFVFSTWMILKRLMKRAF